MGRRCADLLPSALLRPLLRPALGAAALGLGTTGCLLLLACSTELVGRKVDLVGHDL